MSSSPRSCRRGPAANLRPYPARSSASKSCGAMHVHANLLGSPRYPIGRLAPLRAPVLREAQGRIPELEEILCADPDTALHLGLGGHDVEAILSNPGDDLLGHLGG